MICRKEAERKMFFAFEKVRCWMPITEFFEAASKLGFYGLDKNTLVGKKDCMRKYWEDVSIKMILRPYLEPLLASMPKLRVVDLGAGSGEGLELLTRIPVRTQQRQMQRSFVFGMDDIDVYVGLDVSPSMAEMGRKNYAGRSGVSFQVADLSEGFPLTHEKPYDLYFSSYSSLSHLTWQELLDLSTQIFRHGHPGSLMVYDMLGRYSPEWPAYWTADPHAQLPYNMAYLSSEEERQNLDYPSYQVTFWSGSELQQLTELAARQADRKVSVVELKDRSILIGRHMDTGLFNGHPQKIRYGVNCLFDWEHRGATPHLIPDISWLPQSDRPLLQEARQRIEQYHRNWVTVIQLYEALTNNDSKTVKNLIESNTGTLTDDLKMLAWLYRNAGRFPVVDFWASIMGPQIACVLRNLEMSLPKGLGCGHGLFAVVQIEN